MWGYSSLEEKHVGAEVTIRSLRLERKREKKSFYGCKEPLVLDGDSELITAVTVPPGNVTDGEFFIPLVDPHGQEVTTDKGYDTNTNHQKRKEGGQRCSVIVKKNRTNSELIGQANQNSQRECPNIKSKFAEQKSITA